MRTHSRTSLGSAALVCVVGLFVGLVPGEAQSRFRVLQNHVRPAITSGKAAVIASLPSGQQLHLSIVLPLRNQGDLTALLGRLYDPSSPDYRHFLSVEQFTDQFGPTADDYQTVVDFAQANGLTVTGRPANRLIVPVKGTVAQVEKAFNVSMKVYQHPTEERTFFSPDREPSLNLSVPVAHIAGLNNFSTPRAMLTRAAAGQAIANPAQIGSGPNGQYRASDMRAAYYGGSALTGSGQCVGLFELDGYYLADVDLVFSNTGQSYSVPVNNVLLDGATGESLNGDAEPVLDIVQAIGMAPGLSQVRVYIANEYGSGFDDAAIFNQMAAENVCKQLSVSWLWEPEDHSSNDPIFLEFAAQGQSLFVSAGDHGAYSSSNDPWYPADDLYVTAVAGTSLTTNGAGSSWNSEQAWQSSGGGPSPNGLGIPSWQLGVANSSNGASTTLRNVPDVAMEADTDNYNCTMGVCLGLGWGGTSFAAPRWAGFMALVNQQAAAKGPNTVGFINPAIYSIGASSSYGSALHDISSGNDDCCGQSVWYNAVPGYDLVTGWGSPNGQNLIDALAGSPAVGFTLTNSALTTSLSINPGASGAATITVNDQGGFSGSVNLAVSGLPSGVTGTFGTNPTTASSVLTLSAGSSAAPGTAYVTVTGTSGTVIATTTFALTVVGPSFALSVPPVALLIASPSSPATTTVTVNDQDGFTGSVTLAVSGMPSGMTASFSPNPTGGSSVLSFTANSSITVGGFYLTITGTSGALTASTFLYVVVENPFFTLSASPGSIAIGQGATGSSTISVNPWNGFTGNTTLTASGLPSGVTASFTPNPTTGSSVLTLTADSTAAPGTATVTITGSSPGVAPAATSVSLTVNPPAGFTLSASPNNLTIAQGASGTSTVLVTDQGGFTGSVTLAVSGLPSGVTASFGTNPTTGNSVLTLSASNTAILGTAVVTLTGTSNNVPSAGATLTLTVNPPSFTLSANPSGLTIAQGASGASTVTVTGTGALTGSVFLVASNLPSGVTASFSPNPTTGTSVLTLAAGASAALGIATVSVTGSSTGTASASTSLVLLVTTQVSATNEWAWMGGDSSVPYGGGNPGVYGTLGVPAAGNRPGSRWHPATWSDSGGNLWLFGGNGFDANGTYGYLNDLWEFNASTHEWVWLGGSSTVPCSDCGRPGVYGTLGLSAAGNIPGGRVRASAWSDSSGHFWLFGGSGFDAAGNNGDLNDLWEFDPSTNAWTWMGGSSAIPPGRTGNGQPGVYGALGVFAPGNIPGGRNDASSWTDSSGNFWLFGGAGYDAQGNQSYPNDLWEYSPTTKEWAWMGGSSTAILGSGNPGVYGTSGVAAAENVPGSRTSANAWTDTSGNLWLFGGYGYDATGNLGYLNDLWKLSPSTREWAWMGGPSTVPTGGGYPGVYGTLGVAAAGNRPGGRGAASNWVDSSGNLWLFGGWGYGTFYGDMLNDVWKYNPSTNEWTWMGGPSTPPCTYCPQSGVYGTLGVPAAGNIPGGRQGAAAWSDGSGNVWFLGGDGYDANGTERYLNDLWEYQPPAPVPPGFALSASPSSLTLAQGASGTSTITVSGSGGFAGSVTLAASGLPGGVTASFSPNPTTGSSVITLTASSSATPGNYSPVITGTSGTLTATSSLPLTITHVLSTTTSTLSSSANPSSFGQRVTFVAAISPSSATGTVQFLDGTTSLGTATISSGSASLATSTLAVGAHSITAVYSGDANYLTSTSAALAQAVNKAASSVALASSANPSAFGQSVIFTATVSPASATGTVKFLDGTTSLGTAALTGGSAALTMSTLAVGAHSITAVYSGSTNYAVSTSAAVNQIVLPGSPTKLTATAVSSSQINLAWAASPTSGVTYNVYSSTSSTFTPSAANRVAMGLAATTYSNTGLSPSTTHYYVVTALNSAGESAPSNQASATTAAALSCHVAYSVTGQWSGGFGTALTIQNTGSATIGNWNLTWSWPGNQQITQSWNASYTQKGANATLTYESYNATIAPGATIGGIGFNASYSGTNTAPSAFFLNGTLCR